MIELEQIRAFALSLPGVEEGPPVRAARRLAAFKVAGKGFAGIDTGGLAMTVSLAGDDAQAFLAEQPDAYEEIWRDRKFLGLRVDLSKIHVGTMKELVRKSWQHTAANHSARKRPHTKLTNR